MPGNILQIIKVLNTQTTTRISNNNKLTEDVPTPTGIRQGGVKISALGYRMRTGDIKIVCYADNAILISEYEDDLQRLLYAFYLITTQQRQKYIQFAFAP